MASFDGPPQEPFQVRLFDPKISLSDVSSFIMRKIRDKNLEAKITEQRKQAILGKFRLSFFTLID